MANVSPSIAQVEPGLLGAVGRAAPQPLLHGLHLPLHFLHPATRPRPHLLLHRVEDVAAVVPRQR